MGEASGQKMAANGTRRLAEAVRAAKFAAARRSDVVVDIREADRARLEIFAEQLQPIADAVPAEDDLFDFTLATGSQPRYWVDGTAHVMMARDRRTYRLLRETRLGRVTLAESAEVGEIVDRVTDYVAERIVERDRAYAMMDDMGGRLSARAGARSGEETAPLAASPARRPSLAPFAVLWLMIGVLIGVLALIGLAALRGVPLI